MLFHMIRCQKSKRLSATIGLWKRILENNIQKTYVFYEFKKHLFVLRVVAIFKKAPHCSSKYSKMYVFGVYFK